MKIIVLSKDDALLDVVAKFPDPSVSIMGIPSSEHLEVNKVSTISELDGFIEAGSRPDLIIIDLDEVSSNIKEFVRRVKHKSNGTPVITVGHFFEWERPEHHLEIGVDSHIDENVRGELFSLALGNCLRCIKEWKVSCKKKGKEYLGRIIHTDVLDKITEKDSRLEGILRNVAPASLISTGSQSACVLKMLQHDPEIRAYRFLSVLQRQKIIPRIYGESSEEHVLALELIGNTNFTDFGRNHLEDEVQSARGIRNTLREVSMMAAYFVYFGTIALFESLKESGHVMPGASRTLSDLKKRSEVDLSNVINEIRSQSAITDVPVSVLDYHKIVEKFIEDVYDIVSRRKTPHRAAKVAKDLKQVSYDCSFFEWVESTGQYLVLGDFTTFNVLKVARESSREGFNYRFIDLSPVIGSPLMFFGIFASPGIALFNSGTYQTLYDERKSNEELMARHFTHTLRVLNSKFKHIHATFPPIPSVRDITNHIPGISIWNLVKFISDKVKSGGGAPTYYTSSVEEDIAINLRVLGEHLSDLEKRRNLDENSYVLLDIIKTNIF